MNKLNKLISVLAMVALPVWASAAGNDGAHGAMNAAPASTSGHDLAGTQDTHMSTENHLLSVRCGGLDPRSLSRGAQRKSFFHFPLQ